MITFKQHLSESLSSSFPVEITLHRAHGNIVRHHFGFDDNDGNKYHCEFVWVEDQNVLVVDFTSNGVSVRRERNQSSSPLKVYSTIGQQIRKFIADHPTNKITFSAAHNMTIPVYQLLAKRIAKEFGGTVHGSGGLFTIILKR